MGDRYKNRAEMYRERLRRYLVQNEESYPKFYRTISNDADTIPYEILTGISQRVQRVYFEE